MKTCRLPTPLLVALLLQTGLSLAKIDNDFSPYPQGSQDCLYDAADTAGCVEADTATELNQCLCKNQHNFVYNTAKCVALKSPSDVDAVYETLSSNCAGTGVTLSVPKQAFIAAAEAASQSTSTSTSSSSPSATNTDPTTDHDSSGNDLSTGTKIGIGVGVGFGVVVAALAAWFIWTYQRRRRFTQRIHSSDMSNGGAGIAYGGGGSGSADRMPQFAQNNTQQAPAELDPSGYAATGYTGAEDKRDGTGMPLLAELGNSRLAPVELPTQADYLEASDNKSPQHTYYPGQGHPPVSPSTSRSDLPPPFTPSQASESGTYK
ncbi:hypothetical protein F4808DRAFT_458440 [Astrocystis sublimbata]|nr:hypothetical protein F4808DRAFT_458440 [Astrocystis sublimbata]